MSTRKNWINDHHTTSDRFYCDTYPCPEQDRIVTGANVPAWTDDYGTVPGDIPTCSCGNHMEEARDDYDYGLSDYEERRAERAAMGLVR